VRHHPAVAHRQVEAVELATERGGHVQQGRVQRPAVQVGRWRGFDQGQFLAVWSDVDIAECGPAWAEGQHPDLAAAERVVRVVGGPCAARPDVGQVESAGRRARPAADAAHVLAAHAVTQAGDGERIVVEFHPVLGGRAVGHRQRFEERHVGQLDDRVAVRRGQALGDGGAGDLQVCRAGHRADAGEAVFVQQPLGFRGEHAPAGRVIAAGQDRMVDGGGRARGIAGRGAVQSVHRHADLQPRAPVQREHPALPAVVAAGVGVQEAVGGAVVDLAEAAREGGGRRAQRDEVQREVAERLPQREGAGQLGREHLRGHRGFLQLRDAATGQAGRVHDAVQPTELGHHVLAHPAQFRRLGHVGRDDEHGRARPLHPPNGLDRPANAIGCAVHRQVGVPVGPGR
jgi:hypothetical protein